MITYIISDIITDEITITISIITIAIITAIITAIIVALITEYLVIIAVRRVRVRVRVCVHVRVRHTHNYYINTITIATRRQYTIATRPQPTQSPLASPNVYVQRYVMLCRKTKRRLHNTGLITRAWSTLKQGLSLFYLSSVAPGSTSRHGLGYTGQRGDWDQLCRVEWM